MTKKHFIALADRIIKANDNYFDASYDPLYPDTVIEDLADFLQSQNPRFNRERWLGYIAGENGSNGGKIK